MISCYLLCFGFFCFFSPKYFLGEIVLSKIFSRVRLQKNFSAIGFGYKGFVLHLFQGIHRKTSRNCNVVAKFGNFIL